MPQEIDMWNVPQNRAGFAVICDWSGRRCGFVFHIIQAGAGNVNCISLVYSVCSEDDSEDDTVIWWYRVLFCVPG